VNASEHQGLLTVYGPARLVWGTEPLRLRSKGLALLYLLGLEGPVRRERAAELLWGHRDAANNLRVELHRLRLALAARGPGAFPDGQDPLCMPDGIDLDRTTGYGQGSPLQGLDDLAHGFQAWLDIQRSRLDHEHGQPNAQLRRSLIEQLGRKTRQPFLLVLRGPPGAGRHAFLEALAGHLALPLVRGATAVGRALHVLEAKATEANRVAGQIGRQGSGVWALTVSTFGPECELLLRLRQLVPPERMRFVDVGALPWHEARALLLSDLEFGEAARIYVSAGGHQGYMQELLRLRPAGGFDGRLPLPQRIRAGYLLEAKQLPSEARAVLDRLSIHPGELSDEVLDRLGFTEHLDTLETAGWLRFDRLWAFGDETARRVIDRTVQPGRRLHFHARLAEALTEVERDGDLAAAYHRAMALAGVTSGATDAQSAASSQHAATFPGATAARVQGNLGPERAILLECHRQLHARDGDPWSYWVRRPQDAKASFAEFTLPEGPCVLRLRSNVYHERLLTAALDRDTFPLRLWFLGGPDADRQVLFDGASSADHAEHTTVRLPACASGDMLAVCHHRSVRLEFEAEAGIAEFAIEAFQFLPATDGRIDAYDLRDRWLDDALTCVDEALARH